MSLTDVGKKDFKFYFECLMRSFWRVLTHKTWSERIEYRSIRIKANRTFRKLLHKFRWDIIVLWKSQWETNWRYILNVESTGFVDAICVRCEKKKGVKDSFKVFHSLVGWCYLTEMTKNIKSRFWAWGKASRVLWSSILEKGKELIYNQNELTSLQSDLFCAARF